MEKKINVEKIKKLAELPLEDDKKIKRVEIIILKFKEEPKIIDECVSRIINHTDWPFKLNIFDNRPNSANTSKIWNKLIKESTCDYILFIDSDAFVPTDIKPCWLTRLMEKVDLTGLVVPVGDNVGGDNKATGPAEYGTVKWQTGLWSGFCFLIRKDLFNVLNYFDERFYLYGQDSEFAYRTLMHHKALYRLDVFVKHIGSYSADKEATSGTFDRESDKVYARSLFKLIQEKRV